MRPPHRFHHPSPLPARAGEEVALPEAESRHLRDVLRLGAGAEVAVFDGEASWIASVIATGGQGDPEGAARGIARLRLERPEPRDSRPELSPLHVAVSLLKRSAMDDLIEKLTELGVASLQPLVSARTVVRAPDAESDPPERWERIALAAAKQCGRVAPMRFLPPRPLGEWLAGERTASLACFAHTGAGGQGLGEWLSERAGMGLPVLVAIGPEGGWTPEEVERFRAAGFSQVALGPLVLRAETAATTVAAACRVML